MRGLEVGATVLLTTRAYSRYAVITAVDAWTYQIDDIDNWRFGNASGRLTTTPRCPWPRLTLVEAKNDLRALLKQADITIEAFDAWRAASGRCPTADLTPEQREAVALWLAADPARLEMVRGAP